MNTLLPYTIFFKIVFIFSLIVLHCVCGSFAGDISLNPGFEEDADLDGQPDDWFLSGKPLLDADTPEAFAGVNLARITQRHFYIHRFTPFPRTHYTFLGWFSPDIDFGFGGMLVSYWNTLTPSWTVLNNRRAFQFFETKAYHPILLGSYVPSNTNAASLYLAPAVEETWSLADEVHLYNEFIENPGFENEENSEPAFWEKIGAPLYDASGSNAHRGNGAVRVDDTNYYFQRFAVSDEIDYYQISFWAKSAGTPSHSAVEVDWFDDRFNLLMSDEITFTSTLSYQHHIAKLPTPEGAVLATLSLAQPDAGSICWFDNFNLGYVSTPVTSFSPNGDNVRDTTNALFHLNNQTDVSARVVSLPDRSHVKTLFTTTTLPKGGYSTEWNGRDDANTLLPDGSYRFIVTQRSDDTGSELYSTDIEIGTSHVYSSPSFDQGNFFPRGMWCHLVTTDSLRMMPDFHVNSIIIIYNKGTAYSKRLDVANEVGLKMFVNPFRLLKTYVDEYRFYREPPEDEVRTVLTELRDELNQYEHFWGYYTRDEPQVSFAKPLRFIVKALSDIDPVHPGFSSFDRGKDLEEVFTTLEYPVLLSHFYQSNEDAHVAPETFDPFIAHLERLRTLAEDRGTPFWTIVQGFSTFRECIATPPRRKCAARSTVRWLQARRAYTSFSHQR